MLKTLISRPIEREYEAWIVQEIERYFLRLGHQIFLWAVSPMAEATWPADEHLSWNGKVVGLQLKQTILAQPTSSVSIDFSRVKWDLRDPPGQFQAIQGCPEIFYCLPTFINRDWRVCALQHCILWRPEYTDPINYNLWYDNPEAHTPYKHIVTDNRGYRWGYFVERLLNCNIGFSVSQEHSIRQYLLSRSQIFRQAIVQAEGKENDYILYLAYLHFG